MGISIVQKSDLGRPKDNPKIAIVLAGGAVTGGAYKVGGLHALDNCLENVRVTDFDTFVGLSAGSIIASLLANGIRPAEMLSSIEGESERLDFIKSLDFYNPNLEEFIKGPFHFLWDFLNFAPDFLLGAFLSNSLLKEDFRKSVFELARHPSYENLKRLLGRYGRVLGLSRQFPSPLSYLPRGIFKNDRIESALRRSFEENRLPNDFTSLYRWTGKELYVVAVNLDTAERVVFGYNQNNNLAISQAVQASTALPGFYRPARIQGVDYVDGGVRKTANIDVAVESGADLIICYNPFRPFNNKVIARYSQEKKKHVVEGKHIADQGVFSVLNQIFRILLHTRLEYGIDLYRKDPRFRGDIILIEPTEYDYGFFDMNPLALRERQRAARRGYESVSESIERKYYPLRRILDAYGIVLKRPSEDRAFESNGPVGQRKILPFPLGANRDYLRAAS
jgi:predicted acylesterase/phospholipase RssA